MTLVCSFPPIADRNARVLVLGSMPGVASLEAQRYYAHPRNAFWPLMGALVGAGPELDYEERVTRVKAAGVAVWDVLQSCVRKGSLDTAIQDEVPNDFLTFFQKHPGITHVFFNGAKAESSFRRHVLPHLNVDLIYTRLPSTSPAHAGRTFQAKLEAWKQILV